MDLTREQIRELQDKVCEWAMDQGYGSYPAYEYAEPGYTLAEDWVIVFANWNDFTDEVKAELGIPLGLDCDDLEIEAEWSDEWYTCECGKAFRTEPDGYCWTPSFLLVDECELVCIDCVEEDPEQYMEEWINRKVNGARFFNPAAYGFIRVRPYTDGGEQYGSYEHGWHPGQADNLDGQLEILNEAGFDVVFDISSGQFDVKWALWVRPVDEDGDLFFESANYSDEDVQEIREQVREILEHCDACRFDPSPATVMQAALRGASTVMKSMG